MRKFIRYMRVCFKRDVRFEKAVSDFIKILECGLREKSVPVNSIQDLGRSCDFK